MSTSTGPIWPAVQSGTWRLVGICKVNFVWHNYCNLHTDTFVPVLHWDCVSPAEQCSWTLTLGNMGSCSTASVLWQTSHRFSNRRAFPHCCCERMPLRRFVMAHQQCQILNTKQENTLCYHLTTSPSGLVMSPISDLTATRMHSVRTFNQSLHSVCPVLHYNVTSTHTPSGFPLRPTGLASWSSTTSWMLLPCFRCWLYKSEMGRKFWIFVLLLGAKP